MANGQDDSERMKRRAASAALELVEDGMVLGLGTGSTARWFVEGLGELLARGDLNDVSGVPTSLATERLARDSGIRLVELPESGVDLAVDGMDEVDGQLRAIKGLGGALTREKIVAESADRFVLIGDRSKRVERLAIRTPVPVEVIEFGWRRTALRLKDLGLDPVLREDSGGAFRSDNGNLLLDCRVDRDAELESLAEAIAHLPGVLEHGLFLDQAVLALLADTEGVEELRSR